MPMDGSIYISNSQFFTDEFWDLISTETNRYAARLRQQSHYTSPRAWHDVSMVEMKAYIDILILIGVCKLPRLRLYWTLIDYLDVPFFSQITEL